MTEPHQTEDAQVALEESSRTIKRLAYQARHSVSCAANRVLDQLFLQIGEVLLKPFGPDILNEENKQWLEQLSSGLRNSLPILEEACTADHLHLMCQAAAVLSRIDRPSLKSFCFDAVADDGDATDSSEGSLSCPTTLITAGEGSDGR